MARAGKAGRDVTRPLSYRTVPLREAASTIFALVAIVPLLVLVFLLHRYDVLAAPEAQIGLLAALALAILGFFVLQRLVRQVSRLATAVVAPASEGPAAVPRDFGAVNGVGRVAEIGQIGTAFAGMLDDLRTSTARLEDLVFKLGALNEIVELAARVSRIDDLLALVLERSMRTVRATSGSILLLDGERQTLRVAAARGMPHTALPSGDIALGEGFAGAAAQHGEPLVVDDVGADPRANGAPRGSLVAVPLRVEDRIIGVINLVRRAEPGVPPVPFGTTDLQFLTTLMTHVGYSLDNARLLAETRDTATRLTHAVREREAAQQRLVEGETFRAMGQMASGMAHHLNNLLAISSGRIQILLGRTSDGQQRRQLEVARQAMDDAADVVRRVLEFSVTNPAGGDTGVDLNELVREVVELARPRWHDDAQLRGAAITMDQHLEATAPVTADAAPVREVLMNLVLNAVDALPQGGTIGVRTWEAEAAVYCSVSDNGAGMSDDTRRRAIEPFFTTKGPQGVGLGLSVAHAIIQRHRGDLTIESAQGRGTVATFYLPRAGRIAAPGPASPAVAGQGACRRILVVDDQPEVREMLADTLSARGHEVLQAVSGRQAIDRLAAGEPVDLVLTDLGMPDMNGWEVADEVRRRWPDLAVGLVTGWGTRSEATPEQRGRVAFVLAKPFSIDSLIAAVGSVPRRTS